MKGVKRFHRFAAKVSELGGKAYMVGGAVRDIMMKNNPSDYDFVITGIDEEVFRHAFNKSIINRGIRYPVYRVMAGGVIVDVTIAKGSLDEDFLRRDLTINAMAVDLQTGRLIDPFMGRKDIKSGVLEVVSESFSDDPIRVLRAARLAATLGFSISAKTMNIMRSMKPMFCQIPAIMVKYETEKAMASSNPGIYVRVLNEVGAFGIIFPELKKFPSRIIARLDSLSKHGCSSRFAFVALLFDLSEKRRQNLEDRIPRSYIKVALKVVSCYKTLQKSKDIFDIKQALTVIHQMGFAYALGDMTQKNGGCPLLASDALAYIFQKLDLPAGASKERRRKITRCERIRRITEVLCQQRPDLSNLSATNQNTESLNFTVIGQKTGFKQKQQFNENPWYY